VSGITVTPGILSRTLYRAEAVAGGMIVDPSRSPTFLKTVSSCERVPHGSVCA
jgi:hypothetical protein